MAAMPIYGNKLKNILLWNCWTDFNKTFYVALAHHICINHDLGFTMTYFMARSLLVSGFSMEKWKTLDFFRKFCGL